MKSKFILVDMDGVIADYEGGFLKIWQQEHPNEFYVPVKQRKIWDITKQYPLSLKKKIGAIIHQEGFFRSLELIPGALQAINDLTARGNMVFICTSPSVQFQNCVLEKYEWVKNHLGDEWTKKIILTRDKTLIRADYLVDDNPVIEGCMQPSWEHILFDQPWNRYCKELRRIDWSNLKDIFYF